MLPKNSSNQFRFFAHIASNAEKKKKYDLAAQFWNKALAYTVKKENIEWIIRRREFCSKQNKLLK
ncbi:TPA: hypothetical protein GFY81_22980 [Escherichia coli]|uniref:ANR family transcriptional regulator n=1 Tax=Escherichia coli TaxID=562 RepID=UPI000BE5E12C|nr:ANR family transcriptional regulator [Escherichia coli]EGO4630059.1 ANR family transcriptional regulator [Escherichia coli]EIV8827754.1 ANR family transcriptional regulator [Escherichia coli]EKD7865680.1 ANR family transcriptional regulator [Escherichia coli]MCA8591641.1 ANR family transcriptional regulator [Escherichia coli]MCA8597434.1 ANR family transcriptional regulator [Escherichia coli]